MAVETATFIDQLVPSNPAHTDGLNAADSHLRLIKQVLQNQFPNFTAAALNSTEAEIDAAVDLLTGVSGASAFPAGSAATPSIAFTGDSDSGFYLSAEDEIGVAVNGVNVATFTSFGQLCPTGAIVMYQGSAPPSGWAWMNGQTVPAANNPVLAAIYGSSGGNVTLPDWRCYVPGGQDNMGGAGTTGGIGSFTTMGAKVGSSTHALSVGELASHNHSASDSGHGHSDSGHGHSFSTGSGNTHFMTRGTGANADTVGGTTISLGDSFSINTGFANIQTGFANISIGNNGSGTPHNTVQLTVATGYIIKLG